MLYVKDVNVLFMALIVLPYIAAAEIREKTFTTMYQEVIMRCAQDKLKVPLKLKRIIKALTPKKHSTGRISCFRLLSFRATVVSIGKQCEGPIYQSQEVKLFICFWPHRVLCVSCSFSFKITLRYLEHFKIFRQLFLK